jgi:hypothetical protein
VRKALKMQILRYAQDDKGYGANLGDGTQVIRPYCVRTEKEEKQLQILRLRYASLRMTVL